MRNYLGIDVGTSSIKVCIVDSAGRAIADGTARYTLEYPNAGWAEQDPEQWWSALAQAVGGLRQSADASALSSLAAIGMTGQMHTLVAIDAQGRAVRPAISWTDQRSGEQCDYLRRHLGDRVFTETGNPPSGAYTLTKLLWVRDHEPDRFRAIRWVLLPKDYVRYRLTGEIATDYCDASATLAFDPFSQQWAEALLRELAIDTGIFPPVREATDLGGTLTRRAADELGLPAGIPVFVGSGDAVAGVQGAGNVVGGTTAGLSLGSGALFITPSDSPITDPAQRVNLVCDGFRDRWMVLAATQNSGLAIDWYLNKLARAYGLSDQPDSVGAALHGVDPAQRYRRANQAASAVSPGCDGALFLPYLAGERSPHMDENATGVFLGLRGRHTDAHLYRAVLEGIAFALCDALSVVDELGLPVERVFAAGGGTGNALLVSIVAAVLNRPVIVTPETNGTVLGAADYARLGSGCQVEAADLSDPRFRTVLPDPREAEFYRERIDLFRSAYQSLKAFFRQAVQPPRAHTSP